MYHVYEPVRSENSLKIVLFSSLRSSLNSFIRLFKEHCATVTNRKISCSHVQSLFSFLFLFLSLAVLFLLLLIKAISGEFWAKQSFLSNMKWLQLTTYPTYVLKCACLGVLWHTTALVPDCTRFPLIITGTEQGKQFSRWRTLRRKMISAVVL